MIKLALIAFFFTVYADLESGQTIQDSINAINPNPQNNFDSIQTTNQAGNNNPNPNTIVEGTKVQNRHKKTIEQQQMEVEQLKLQAQDKQELNEGLSQWQIEQLSQLNDKIDLPISQTFGFILEAGEMTQYRWQSPVNSQLKMIVSLFQPGQEGKIMIDSVKKQKEETIMVTEVLPEQKHQVLLGEVHLIKAFTCSFTTSTKMLRFRNKMKKDIFLQVIIEKTTNLIDGQGVNDEVFGDQVTTITEIEQEMQSGDIKREHLYKWEWGFMEKQSRQHASMLSLTGIQLLAILITSCVQMYSIKNILDNRAVV